MRAIAMTLMLVTGERTIRHRRPVIAGIRGSEDRAGIGAGINRRRKMRDRLPATKVRLAERLD